MDRGAEVAISGKQGYADEAWCGKNLGRELYAGGNHPGWLQSDILAITFGEVKM